MGQLDISIAMCTYNGSRFLREQLESIAAQTRLPEELVICDDCSEDQTVEVVKDFAQKALFPVRLEVNTTNLGSTKNFENAVRLCRGNIIALADQDDVWHPKKLSCMVDVFKNNQDIGAAFSDAQLIDQDSHPLARNLWSIACFSAREQDSFDEGQGLGVLLKRFVVTGAAMAFRSEFRDLVLPIPRKQIHDCWIALLIASVSHLAPIRNTLIQYRKHEGQQLGPWIVDSLWHQVRVSRCMSRDYVGEAERFDEVCDRLHDRCLTFRPHSYALPLIQQKISHHRTRGSFPKSRFLRIPSLIRETATLRYWRYSNGLGSVARDLLL